MNPVLLPASVISSVSLASVIDQSRDCVKLVGTDGKIQYMNFNGLCAMQIDDFCAVDGKPWADLWPDEARQAIEGSYATAASGEPVQFKAFCPTAKGEDRWWHVTVTGVFGNDGDHVGFLAVSRDITETETSREVLLVAASELQHRLKNTYSIIGSLMMGFARGNPEREKFAHEMTGRLQALSTAQSLFMSDAAPCEIRELVPALLEPFDNPSCPIAIDELPSRCVDQGQADAIALIIGELAVNSAKHGALAHGGDLRISAGGSDAATTIVWTERSSKPVAAHARDDGQGIKLIQRIARARRGTIDLAWADFGLTVTISFQR